MLSRALTLAAASLCCLVMATAGQAQNLDAGKSPSQIFNSSCTACHKSARGLLKTVAPSALPGFLRQHYTTGSEMAQMLSGFLMSNGAAAAEERGSGRRGATQDAGPNLRNDAPIGVASPAEQDKEQQVQRRDRNKQAAPAIDAKPDADGVRADEQASPGGRKSRKPKPDVAVSPETSPKRETGVAGDESGSKAGNRKPSRKRKGEPPQLAPSAPEPGPAVAAKPAPEIAAKPEPAPQPMTDRAIDAAVPVPEPVDIPPPTAADIKPEPSADAPKHVAEPKQQPVEAQKPAAEPSKQPPKDVPPPATAPAPLPPISR